MRRVFLEEIGLVGMKDEFYLLMEHPGILLKEFFIEIV
jgi:hypothetical protein